MKSWVQHGKGLSFGEHDCEIVLAIVSSGNYSIGFSYKWNDADVSDV